jgi:CheY-like chemotaxis protein/anti-sigma regulatory factor (Ser/Thr protein kinase)
VANGSGRTLLALIDDILDLSKIEARKIRLENVSFDARAAIEETIHPLRVQASDKGLLLRVHVSADLPGFLRGDEHRLRQILTNLCANAIKFTDRGEVRVDVSLLSSDDGKATVRFAITDTGIGIPAERAAAIFLPFVQADISTTRKYGGTGLGLAISKQLVTMMGGSIHVESKEGQGSSFIFTAIFERAAAGQSLPAGGRRRRDSTGPKGRILVAEDNVVNREVALALLRKLGYEAEAVKNGIEVITEVERGGYDLVLMDCEMPVMDGFEATRRIRESLRPNIPIIALTANAMTDDRSRCLREGMNDYLAKPVDLGRLEDVLDRWLGSSGEMDGRAEELGLARY